DFHRARGLPSYSEGVPNLEMGIDLVAALYRGLLSYAAILRENGKANKAALFEQKAAAYRKNIEKYWWDDKAKLYNTFYSNSGEFGKNEGETFLLWFNALNDNERKQKTFEHLLHHKWNVENMSYFPYIFYRNGYWDDAARYMLLLTNPATERREYPEVSFGVVLGFVNGLMGIEPDARFNRVSTIYKTNSNVTCTLQNVPLLGGWITVKHQSYASVFTNRGLKKITWRAEFYGSRQHIIINGKAKKAVITKDDAGKIFSYTDVPVRPGKTATAIVQ
ncbi:MAG TPA: trehalase family glycosidase, partial [Chitinophagaceae bacterium]|nr:trehalase family glycosidase [Chitinophagaceae bacterium]